MVLYCLTQIEGRRTNHAVFKLPLCLCFQVLFQRQEASVTLRKTLNAYKILDSLSFVKISRPLIL